MPLNQYHAMLLGGKEFAGVLEQLARKMPTVPEYDPEKDNFREIVFETARKKGFELALAHLGYKP